MKTNKIISKGLIVIFLLSFLSLPALAKEQPILIKNGTIVPVTRPMIKNGDILIEGGKIVAVGKMIKPPAGAKVINAEGLYIYPGMIDAYSDLGMVEVGMVSATVDTDETTKKVTPFLTVLDAINPDSTPIPVTRVNGVTTALVSPGSTNPIAGKAAVIDLAGRTVDEMLVKSDAAMIFSFTRRSFRGYESEERRGYPSTRMGIAALIRQTLIDTQDYLTKLEAWEKKGKKGLKPPRNLTYEALIPVLKGEMPVMANVREAREIRVALDVADSFNLKLILLNAHECDQMMKEIKERNIPILVGNIFTNPDETKPYDFYYKLPLRLYKNGIKFAIYYGGAHSVRNLPYSAAVAAAYGLPEEEALKSVTIYPAEILGVEDKVGSIEKGKLANLVIFTGDPLQVKSRVKHLIIKGKLIPLKNHDTELRDGYLHLYKHLKVKLH
jgi:imidazolonepropionase-like amidohydrolase